MSRVQPPPPNLLSRLLEPVEQMMPVEFARELAALRATPEVEARVEALADKCNEGRLTPEERAEYDAYIDAIDLISILQAKARNVLARHPNA
jgi:hypothetical protein